MGGRNARRGPRRWPGSIGGGGWCRQGHGQGQSQGQIQGRGRGGAAAIAAVLLGAICPLPAPARAATPDAAPETARPCSSPAEAAPQRILVTVSGARRVAGNITFTLYGDQPDRFLAHRGKIALDRVMLAGTSASTCFVVSRPGTYAVAVYHDENNNHHFDRSLIGLPLEGYGFSRNPALFLAPPSFGVVRFTAGPGDTSLAIALRY